MLPGPSIRPSVRSPKYPLSTCTWMVWWTNGLSDQLWPFSACLSVRLHPERFPGIFRRAHGGNGMKYFMLMYLDHLQNWLDNGHGLLIYLPMAPIWLCKTCQIWGFRVFSREHMAGMAWNFVCRCILTTCRTDEISVFFCWFSFWWCPFELVRQVVFWVSMEALSGEGLGANVGL